MTFIDDGTEWRPYFGGANFPGLQPPPAASWTQIGSASTMVDDKGTLLFSIASAANDIWQYNTALGGTYTLDIAFNSLWAWDGTGGHEPVFGVALRNAGSGKFTRLAMYYTSSGGIPQFQMQVQNFSDLNTTSGGALSTILNTGIMGTSSIVRFRVSYDGANVSLHTGQDGGTFGNSQYTFAPSYASPDHFGIFVAGTSGATIPSRLLSLGIGP